MSSLTLERRVKALELQLAQLQDEVRSFRGGKSKDWRRTIGAFTGDEGLKEILQEAMRLRNLDRKKTRSKAATKQYRPMILLDTDHFSVVADARHVRHPKLVARLSRIDDTIGIPVIAVEEQLRAWLAQIHRAKTVHDQVAPYDRLIRLLTVLSEWETVRWSDQAADEFARLRKARIRIRIGTQDLKIAALSIVNRALLLSANLRDFEQVPNLRVEDWLYE